MIGDVFPNNLTFGLFNLNHYSNRHELFKIPKHFPIMQVLLLGRPTGQPRPDCRPALRQKRPASEPAQTGVQAGA